MAVEIQAKMKPKNNNTFALIDAKDIEVDGDGKRLPQKLTEIEDIINNFKNRIATIADIDAVLGNNNPSAPEAVTVTIDNATVEGTALTFTEEDVTIEGSMLVVKDSNNPSVPEAVTVTIDNAIVEETALTFTEEEATVEDTKLIIKEA